MLERILEFAKGGCGCSLSLAMTAARNKAIPRMDTELSPTICIGYALLLYSSPMGCMHFALRTSHFVFHTVKLLVEIIRAAHK